MTVTTLTSRELDQDVARARKATRDGPVIITDGGRPSHVLLSIEAYRRLTGQRRDIADSLAMPGDAVIDFEPPSATITARPADL